MLNRMRLAIIRSYIDAKMKMDRLCKEEDGMETLETVILIVVAVVVAGLLIEVLTKSFGGNEQGFIGYLFGLIQEKVEALFGPEG